MVLFFRIIVLLWVINIVPVVLTWMLQKRFRMPVDAGCMFPDGRPVLGKHKTIRGTLGAILVSLIFGMILGFPYHLAFLIGVLVMAGDLFASFIKRRAGLFEGTTVPMLDQIPEVVFPLIILIPYFELSITFVVFLIVVFAVTAMGSSVFVNHVLLVKPFKGYSRKIVPKSRFREWRSCQTISDHFHSMINFEQGLVFKYVVKNFFKITGLYDRGVRNALDIRLKKITINLPNLPVEFDGYTIMYLSDLHLDCLPKLSEKIQMIITDLEVDLCILGGDYRTNMYGCFNETIQKLKELTGHISAKQGIYAVLGNHDCLEIIEPLRDVGIKFLVNSSACIEKDNQRVWLCGVDDSFYYEGHDVKEAFKNVNDDGFVIFLAHEPGLYADAASNHSDLYLCGHTHGGQILVPGLGPIITHCRGPKSMVYGRWSFGRMQGYTSSGVGTSGLPVRYGCRGEVVHLTLRKSDHSSSGE